MSDQFYAVIGYADRVECMEGKAYYKDPPKRKTDANPNGWIWIRSIGASEAANSATAVYKAVLANIPSDALFRVVQAYLGEKNWTLDSWESDDVEGIDRLLKECDQPSLFAGLERSETNYGDIKWVEQAAVQPAPPEPQAEDSNCIQQELEV